MYRAQFASRIFYVPFLPYNRNSTDQLQTPTFPGADADATGDHSWTLQLVTLAEPTHSAAQFAWLGLSLSLSPSCSLILLVLQWAFPPSSAAWVVPYSSRVPFSLPEKEAQWLEHSFPLLVQIWSSFLCTSLPWLSSHHYCAGAGDPPLLPLLLSKSDSNKDYTVYPTSCFLQSQHWKAFWTFLHLMHQTYWGVSNLFKITTHSKETLHRHDIKMSTLIRQIRFNKCWKDYKLE